MLFRSVEETVSGKRVVLVDDSIVRGTTIKQTVKMLKDAGAKEVHIRISSPKVTHSCYLGMDTPKRENLIGSDKTEEEVEEIIGADSLHFLSLDGMLQAVGKNNGFCKGCFTGNYPVERME